MDYQQEYLRDEYIELRMPAGQGSDGQSTYLLDPNHLHIWPRRSFMLIALANKVFRSAWLRFPLTNIFPARIKHLLALYLRQARTSTV